MNKLKTYNDSKEFPLLNYERINSTGDFLYMVKGYDAGDEVDVAPDEMEALYNKVVQDYVVSLNSRNYDIMQYGKINAARIDLMKYIIVKEIIQLKIQEKAIRDEGKLETDIAIIAELLSGIRIQKSTDLNKQVEIIDRKIEKLKNDMAEAEKKIEKNNPQQKSEQETDINEMITNVELILERGIDMQKTSLYRFGIMQEQARKKIDHLNKQK